MLRTVLGTNLYATHRTNSVVGHAGTSTNEWSFTWTAPATRDQEVIFYAAFVAANGNGSTSGDFVYTYSTQGIYIRNSIFFSFSNKRL